MIIGARHVFWKTGGPFCNVIYVNIYNSIKKYVNYVCLLKKCGYVAKDVHIHFTHLHPCCIEKHLDFYLRWLEKISQMVV